MNKILTALLACFLTVVATAQEASVARNSNLRTGPSTSSRVLDLLPAGTAVTIISKYPRAGYVRVTTAKDGKTGWVYQKNVGAPAAGESAAISHVQSAPVAAPGARAGDSSIYPIATLTPGKADPTVTQGNIATNICNKGWSTGSVRPDVSVTNKIKVETMKSYGFTDAANHYELDHLLSLQNGGCPDCVENLWPEAYGDQKHPMTQNDRAAWNKKTPATTDVLPGALEKDLVENHIHDEICVSVPNGKMSMYAKKYPATVSVTLQRGQEILATDWYACYVNMMNGNKPCQ